MHSCSGAHCSCRQIGRRSRLLPSRVSFRFWASPFPSRLANASGRIVFIMVLIMDWQFVSGCFPPRLSPTQFPSTTDSQCSVRWGLSPHCWCALSGALGRVSPRPQDQRQPIVPSGRVLLPLATVLGLTGCSYVLGSAEGAKRSEIQAWVCVGFTAKRF
jgi:hypothetical protein